MSEEEGSQVQPPWTGSHGDGQAGFSYAVSLDFEVQMEVYSGTLRCITLPSQTPL